MHLERTEQSVDYDCDVRAALEWLLDVSENRRALEARIIAAQAYYYRTSAPALSRWPNSHSLVIKDDLIASYLSQAVSLLTDRRSYDLVLGAKVIPFIRQLGRGVPVLREMVGADIRARRLLNPRLDHPDGAIFELAGAIRYAMDDYEVEFISEGASRRPDLKVGIHGVPKMIEVEFKRLRQSTYELREMILARKLFAPLDALIRTKRLSVYVDVNYKQELSTIPEQYLVEKVDAAVKSPIILPDGYPWSDAYADGAVFRADIDAVKLDTRDSSLLVGPKLARLLSGRRVSEGTYFLSLAAETREDDPRFIDDVYYASVVTWQCSAVGSIESRARYIRSKLADLDIQMLSATLGIAHIAMDAERDVATADLRRQRNLGVVRTFRARSNLAEVNLHYYLPHVTESTSWTIDETVDWNARLKEPLLSDPRILLGQTDFDSDRPAWHLPPP